MSKHNNQYKFPQGQFISQLHPQCDLVEILLQEDSERQAVIWESYTVHKERNRYIPLVGIKF